MKPKSEGGRPVRLLRVGENLRHAIVEVLVRGEVHAADFDGRQITVTEVTVSPDLRHANIYVMPLAGAGDTETVAALNRLAGPIAHAASRHLRLKYMPRLRFHTDASFAEASHVEAILRSPAVARDLAPGEDED